MKFPFDIQFFGGGGERSRLAVIKPGVPGFDYPQNNNNAGADSASRYGGQTQKDGNTGGGGYYGPSSMPQLPSGTQQYTAPAWNNTYNRVGHEQTNYSTPTVPNLQQVMERITRQGK